ncbi:alkaline phosphatase D family protein, partial [Ilumatobacter nonamiensis]|uniref:alkaline phosphatase D family protein n=1 Tax=Ilumatobacter nonamiensis TaxID=467093 RepID=UPI001F4C7B06
MSRRRFLALSATFAATACSSGPDEVFSPPRTGSSSTTGSTTTTPPTTVGTARTTTPLPTQVPTTTEFTTTTEATTTTTEPATDPDSVELVADPFVFGVASGDPDTSSVVLWTRLADVVGAFADVPDGQIPVRWTFIGSGGQELDGVATTDASVGYSLHVVIPAIEPGNYTFSVGGFRSPVGRAAPINTATSEYRIAAGSCQNYQTGHYAAHRDIAEWVPDLVVWLGDFIYEGGVIGADNPRRVRDHEGAEPLDLVGYRQRYATYLSDPQLQASRAAAPWLSIWDDHEVENDYAGLVSQNEGEDPASFAQRRAQAYQAWWENTPTRLEPPAARASIDEPYVISRGIDVGGLVRISALDGRQFRSPHVSREILDPGPPAEGWDDPDRTMLGEEQEEWIAERFATSTATWNCLANQTVLSDTRLEATGAILNYDQWDGYHPARERLLADAPPNLVAITGDIHLAMVGELGPAGAPVGIEFVNTAIASPPNVDPGLTDVFLALPTVVDANLAERGYTRHTITPDAWTAE